MGRNLNYKKLKINKMEKNNIAELLRNCPKGMELYSPIFGEVYLDNIRPHLAIVVTTDKEQGDFKEEFLYDGRYGINGECMLFPSKDKITWDDFVPPCNFKDGDILYVDTNNDEDGEDCFKYVFILKEMSGRKVIAHCYITAADYFKSKEVYLVDDAYSIRFATEDEKIKLFDAIKANGYKWNAETKTLEKIVEPIFKVGYKIKRIKTGDIYEIIKIIPNYYIAKYLGSEIMISFNDYDEYDIVSNKFDISNLKPFDRVLVRPDNKHRWSIQFFERLNNVLKDAFVCMGGVRYHQCIPYEGNEHLLNTANECDNFFKVWK